MKTFADFINESKSGDSSLRDWFSKSSSSDGTPGWVQLGGKYAGKPCAKQPGQTTKPKCGSSKMKANLSDEEEEKAFRRKNREDGDADRKGKAKNVATEAAIDPRVRTVSGGGMLGIRSRQSLRDARNKDFKNKVLGTQHEIKTKLDQLDKNPPKVTSGSVRIRADIPEEFVEEGKKDACYHKVKSRYRIWPSAYASGALVKCRKVGAKNWGNKTKKEEYEYSDWREEYTKGMRKKGQIKVVNTGETLKKSVDNQIMTDPNLQLIKKKFKKEDISLEAPSIEEAYTKLQERGKTYHVRLNWRGKYLGIQLFFPQFNRPTKMQVSSEVEKIYPGALVISYQPHFRDPTKAFLYAGTENESRRD